MKKIFLFFNGIIVLFWGSFSFPDSGWPNWSKDSFSDVFYRQNYLSDVRLADIFGRKEIKKEAKKIIDMLKNYYVYSGLGAKLPLVLTIQGESATGRTLLAKAIAGEAGASFVDYDEVPSQRVCFKLLQDGPVVVFVKENSSFSVSNLENDIVLQDFGKGPYPRLVIRIKAVYEESKEDSCCYSCGDDNNGKEDFFVDREKILYMPPLDQAARLGLLKEFIDEVLFDESLLVDGTLNDLAEKTENYNVSQLKYLINQAALFAGEDYSLYGCNKYCVKKDDLYKAYSESGREFQSGSGGGSFFVDSFHYTYAQKERFSDVIGIDHVLTEVKEFVDILKNGERYEKIGVSRPKGLLLEGLPGVGKTLIARAIAGEAGCCFISVSGSQFVNGWVGGGPDTIRKMFAFAKQLSKGRPVIIFVDEFDSLGKRSEDSDSVSSEYSNTINEFLKQLDGFDQNDNILIVAATNHADKLDPALVREGRFDRKVYIPLPDEEGRQKLLNYYMKRVNCRDFLRKPEFMKKIARMSRGFSGAGIKTLVNEAAILAVRDNVDFVEKRHFLDAYKKIAGQIQSGVGGAGDDGFAYTFSEETGFKDVLGIDEVVEEVKVFVDTFKNREVYKKMGVSRPKGMLLYGPPGTGKTLLARAIAGESGSCFISVSASQFVKLFVGSGPANIRKLFGFARKMARNKPCIIFFDEMDAFGKRQSFGSEYNNTINELLTQIDGFNQDENIAIIGATNNIHLIDDALIRDGRFDIRIEIPFPSSNGRESILKHYLKKVTLASDVSVDDIAREWAKRTILYSGASLEGLVKKAALRAIRSGSKCITSNHFEEAYLNDCLGVHSKIEQTCDELKKTACHEAGHALISVFTGYSVPCVSILSRSGSLGVSFRGRKHEVFSNNSKHDLMHNIMIMLGGYCAEELIYGQPTPGAQEDLDFANRLAMDMVSRYGMGGGLHGVVSAYILSDKIKESFDMASFDVIQRCLVATQELLKENKKLLEKLATALLEKETMSEVEVYKILGKPVVKVIV